jgi:hypothetical protein
MQLQPWPQGSHACVQFILFKKIETVDFGLLAISKQVSIEDSFYQIVKIK